jgi:hypothetical protein
MEAKDVATIFALGKPCSKMLRGLEVVKTNDIAQASNQTIQLQPSSPLLGT